ncbi:MAG TPA: LamG-like jellyroll fold domain-containing protein, partial [Candidatus Eisenbacteria bacterium]|nr:LamG-like jellyroll fold domain-containing protein [Candidatus Eisenbacteria bacterium]
MVRAIHRVQAVMPWMAAAALSLTTLTIHVFPAHAQSQQALQLNGSTQYVTFGTAASLGASSFTVEVRFKRTGAGGSTSTGTGGWASIVPLLTKGRGEGETPANLNMNYFLGIRSDGRIAADFEEPSGPNRPLGGEITTITNDVWYHAAVTFDAATRRYVLYLNGAIENDTTLAVGIAPASTSIQHAALGTAMTSTGVAAGFFQGIVDEARIWNVARTDQQILDSYNAEVLAGSGLIGRWGLNEGTGANAGNSIAGSVNGTLIGTPLWTTDSPLALSAESGLRFGGTNAYVTFGNPAELHLANFTVETWFRRDGAGTASTTGTGGFDGVPLVARGTGESENPAVDMNYYLGIRSSDNVLAADLEEGAAGAAPSQNHPVFGVTPIANGVWYHAAATYDGNEWRLYLNGSLEAQLTVGQPAAAAGNQLASLASGLESIGTAEGFFNGALDEARVWSVARTQAEIQGSMNSKLAAPTSGLVARWGLDEDAQITVSSTAGTAINGTITGSNWSWAGPAPFNATLPSPPSPPTGLAAVASGASQINLTWTDASNDETGFEIERSTTGSGGPFTPLVTVPANTVAYPDNGLTASTEYCYRVRAVNGAGPSSYAGPSCAMTTAVSTFALDFAGTNAYVNFGNPASLHLTSFTLEMWMRQDGAGVGTDTGSGGIPDAIPLLTRGRAETEAAAVDVNYLFGIRASSGVLCADFEEGAGGAAPSQNHPIEGSTVIGNGVWHHVAATYDGTWKLYIDGALDAQLAVGQPPAAASNVAVALASALNSTNVASGFFNGVVDEVRVWNVARTQAEIQTTINTELTAPTSGLVARWALDEGSGTAVNGSAGTTVNGNVAGAGFAWVAGAPFNITPPTPPADPSGLSAGATSSSSIHLAWTDNASTESAYEVERSTTGIGGPFSLRATLAANANSYDDNSLSASTEYCYRVRAKNGPAASGYAGPSCATTQASTGSALDFAGSTYVSFGDPAALDLAQFTVECWFRRDGTGTTTTTGSGGIATAIPLVTKGTSESDSPANLNMNYFFGIDDATDRLMADFEDAVDGTNHPVLGATTIANGVWHHAAVTYDGNTWQLYLDGNLETSLAVGVACQSASIQPAALASSLRSNGTTAQGFFDGVLDEVRIWNTVRTQAEIQSTANAQIAASTSGLVARWALDEGSGTAVNGSAGTAINGGITGVNYTWVSGAPFDLSFNLPPAQPTVIVPANNATGVSSGPSLYVSASDPEGQNVTVTWYGRPLTGGPPGPNFTLIGQPDTQYYTGEDNGGTIAILESINNWIAANRASRNIAYVATLGDCVERGDNGGDPIEWQLADQAFSLIEDPQTTGLTDGIPYGITVGNHDQSPIGDADGATNFYNQYFGEARFQGRGYYGGHYGANNDNWYNLFSAGGMDFIVISLEYDTSPDQAVLDWADQLLATHSNRRGIVLSHNLCGTGNPATFSTQGSATYNALRDNPNFFLMLAGHVPGEGRRQDTFNNVTVNTLMSDYQGRTNGGNGWIRIMTFSPANNTIEVETYSPWLSQFETDADSRFTLTYNMTNLPPFQLLGSSSVASGSNTAFVWSGLAPSTQYEWYATVSDGSITTTGPAWKFTTSSTVGVRDPVAAELSLGPVSPNPAPGHAQITFTLPRPTPVRLSILDIQGREVAVLAEGTFDAGRHPVRWNGQSAGRSLPAGLYMVRLQTPERSLVRKTVW